MPMLTEKNQKQLGFIFNQEQTDEDSDDEADVL